MATRNGAVDSSDNSNKGPLKLDNADKFSKVASKFANMTAARDSCIRCGKAVYATEREK